MKQIQMGLLASTIVLFTGCGGGGSTPTSTVTGQFVDTYVQGLDYACSSGKTDITNSLGEYTCNTGDIVTFSVGNYVIGSTDASEGIITPYDLYPEDDAAALNVAQLLQSLDDGSSEGIIVIPEDFADLDDVNTTPEDENFDQLIDTALVDVSLVTEDEATTHLQEAELTLLVSGKTFYIVEADYVDSLVINENVTSATWTTIASIADYVGDTGTDGLEITTTEGSLVTRIKVTPEEIGEESFHLLLNNDLSTDDYLLFNVDGSDEQIRFYFDQATAEAYYDSLQPEPTIDYVALLAGKTFYIVEASYIDRTVFNADVTSATWVQIVGNNVGETATDTFLIDGEKLIITSGEDGTVFSVVLAEETTDYLLFNVFLSDGTADGQVRLYFDQADAEAYYDSLQSETPTLESLIIGQTYYVTTCDHVETLVFGTDGQATVTGIENGVEYSETYVYSIEGGVATVVIPDEGTHTFTNPVVLTDWIAFTDAEGQETGRFFFDYDTAEATLSYDCGSSSPTTIPITQLDLTSNTFYSTDTDNLGYAYAKMTFTATEGTRHEIWYNTDGSLRSDDTFYFPIALIDGMLRADVTQFDEGYMWFTLISEDVSTWIVLKEQDLEMDGVDGIETKVEEWLLSKPVDYPASL